MFHPDLTPDKLSTYYDTLFFDDLRLFYLFREENGVTIMGHKRPPEDMPYYLPVLYAALHGESDVHKKYRRMSGEEELYFISLLSYVFTTEHRMYYFDYKDDWMEAARLMNSFGLPWISAVETGMDVDFFLLKDHIHTMAEALVLRDVMDLVFPFMNEKFHLYVNCDIVERWIDKMMVTTYRQFYEYHGLLGLDFSCATILQYYRERFLEDLKKYFSCATQKNGYKEVLSIDYHANIRWEDGMPGRNASENLVFASILLFQYIAQQCILRICNQIERDFHEYSGWPRIYTGPSGGGYLHPLRMLEYAGLMPKKNETHLFLEAVQAVFGILRPELNCILNGRFRNMMSPPDEDRTPKHRFLNAIRGRDRVKSKIRKYMDTEEQNIPRLLLKWETSPSEEVFAFLEEEGIPIMDYGD